MDPWEQEAAQQRAADRAEGLCQAADDRASEPRGFYCDACGARQAGAHRCIMCHARIDDEA